ncbi:MAG: hypothetical protein IJ685_08355 [Selenomonadaceae bacterium]|nr:hypothetical protein [Selenomonadaceae bacterium]
MGFFDEIADTFKVVKDIVHGGIESYKAGEKLDALVVRVEKDFGDALTDDDKKLLKQYKKSAQAYEDNTDSDKNDSLLQKMEDDRIAFLEAAERNSSLNGDFRFEIKLALKEFKQAENLALESAADTIEKYAENDEQREQVRKTFNESKRK